jgi:flagellar motility protein MotE (MotC chaperone)
MAEQDEQITYDSFDGAGEKSSAPLWISFVIGSLVLSFIGTFMWVLYVEEPTNQEQQVAMADSLMVTDSTLTDSTAIANTITPADSLKMLKDSLMALESGLEVANKTIEQLSDTTEEEPVDYRQLAKIYSQMDADAAAEILSKLDDAMIVGILEKMRDRNAAELLAVIERNRAAQLSEKLTKTQRVN